MVEDIHTAKRRTRLDLVESPNQGREMVAKIREGKNINTKAELEKGNVDCTSEYPKSQFGPDATVNTRPRRDAGSYTEKKFVREFYNTEFEVNSPHYAQLKKYEPKEMEELRVGVLAYKIGMTHVWDKWGQTLPLTVLQVDRCQVTQVKTQDTDGFNALQVGFGGKSMRRVRKSLVGHLLKAGVPPKMKYVEFKVAQQNLLPLGYQLSAWHYTPGQWVDCSSKNKGDGTQGVMKAWNFGGQPASHGVSLAHRSLGSTGMNQSPGKVFKGKKMPGKFGGKQMTKFAYQVYRIDVDRCLVYIKGMVPGPRGAIVKIRDSILRKEQNFGLVNHPTFIPDLTKRYASVVEMLPSPTDPMEDWIHDNAIPKQLREEMAE